jgi:hypothetical protein
METNFRPEDYRVTKHARERVEQRGFTMTALLGALREPEKVYESKKFAGQLRVVAGEMCLCVDPAKKVIVTVFFDQRLDEKNYKG